MDSSALAVVPEAAPGATLTAPVTHAGALRALRDVMFRRYFAGQVLSAAGSFLQQTAVGWLVLQLTGSATLLGLVLAAGGVPSLLFGPFGGAVADRVDNRRLLIVTQSLYSLAAGALFVFAVTGRMTVIVIVVVSVATGIVSIVDSPARQAFISQLVPDADMSSAISLNGVVMNSARVVGPAIAGAVIVTAGTTPCFAVNAVSYLLLVAALVAVTPMPKPQMVSPAGSGLGQALHYVRRFPQLWLPLAMMLVVGLFAFNFTVVLPLLAKQTFDGNAGTYGLISTLLSVGSVLGSLAVGTISHPRRTYLLAAVLLFGVSLVFAALAPTVWGECVALLFVGFFGFTFVTLCSSTLQLHAAPALRGRVMALWVFVYLGTTPIGSILTGWLSREAGPRAALWLGAGACLIGAAIAARIRTPPPADTLVRAGA